MPASSATTPAGATVAFVRPGRDALHWLRATVDTLKAGDPLRPVTLIVPNYNAGRLAATFLAQAGGYLNLRVFQLGEYAETLAGRHGAAYAMLNDVLRASAIRAALAGAPLLRPLTEHASLQSAVAGLFGELRRQEIDAEALLTNETSPTARAALTAYRRYQQITENYLDQTGVRGLAVTRLETAPPDELADFGALAVLLPGRLDPVDVRLLAASARFLPLHVALPFFGDAQDGDDQARAMASGLANALGLDVPFPGEASQEAISPDNLRIVRAPSPADEVREALRRVAEDLEQGVPLHRMAILYRQPEPYAAIVRESLDLAGMPWNYRRGLAESLPGRALIALLNLPAQNFARGAVIGWLDAVSANTQAEAAAPALWDRIAREAGVTAGLEQWQRRLVAHAAGLKQQARDDAGKDLLSPGAHVRMQADADAALALAARVADLGHALQAPAEGSPWTVFVDWVERLWIEKCGGEDGWPPEERPFAQKIPPLLERLRAGGRFQTEGPSPALFVATVQSALANQARPIGRLGEGILIGPVQSVNGLAFDRVHILGLSEGSFPPRPPLDPFFPQSDPLGRAERHRAGERHNFLTALATADGGRATLYAPDASAGRPAFPSRYLLEVASLCASEALDTATFRNLRPADCAWLSVLASAEEAAARAQYPADCEDLRLGRAVRWTWHHRPLRRHPLARDPALPLGAALSMSDARRSHDFTPFDGNLAGCGVHSVPSSTSAVERWATCPFRYYLSDVLRVRPTPRPEDTWTIDALERGTLVHRILYSFFKQRQERAGQAASFGLSAEDGADLQKAAGEEFERTADRGLAGHPLVWENVTAALLLDLHTYLDGDARRRYQEGLTPIALEAPFGAAPDGWQPVELEAAGETLRFRGVIDRIDAGEDGRRLELLDYKTGHAEAYRRLDHDPVLAGQHIQLAMYLLAVRRALAAAEAVRASYWFVTSRGGFKPASLPDDLDFIEARLREVLEQILTGMGAGAFPQVPGDNRDPLKHCQYCDFDRICPAARDDAWQRKGGAAGYHYHAGLALPEPEP